MPAAKLAPVHPGEVLLGEFLEPLIASQYRLAKDITVPPRRINEIVHGKCSVTADTALRLSRPPRHGVRRQHLRRSVTADTALWLSRYFGTSERFWLNLRAQYDLDIERDRLGRASRPRWFGALADARVWIWSRR